MTFLKYIFNHTKPCLQNVKELASDHRSEKNFAKTEKVWPQSAKGSCVLFDAQAPGVGGSAQGLMVSFLTHRLSGPTISGIVQGAGNTRWTTDWAPALRSSWVSTALGSCCLASLFTDTLSHSFNKHWWGTSYVPIKGKQGQVKASSPLEELTVLDYLGTLPVTSISLQPCLHSSNVPSTVPPNICFSDCLFHQIITCQSPEQTSAFHQAPHKSLACIPFLLLPIHPNPFVLEGPVQMPFPAGTPHLRLQVPPQNCHSTCGYPCH